jgi:hypothetical protein
MATASDSMAALQSFQRDLDRLPLTPTSSDPNLFYYLDQPEGTVRMAFVRLQGRTVTALATFFASNPVNGVMDFHGFYAVPEAYRNQGRAKDVLGGAIRQIAQGIGQTGMRAIHVTVMIEAENTIAQRVAAAVISQSPSNVTDQATGRPALLYSTTLTAPAH